MSKRHADNDSQRLLLVEGADDKAVIIHLGKVVDRFPTFFASPRGSVEQVLDAVRQEIRASGRRAVGIVVDANDSLDNRWKAIAARLKSAGADVPGRPHADRWYPRGEVRQVAEASFRGAGIPLTVVCDDAVVPADSYSRNPSAIPPRRGSDHPANDPSGMAMINCTSPDIPPVK